MCENFYVHYRAIEFPSLFVTQCHTTCTAFIRCISFYLLHTDVCLESSEVFSDSALRKLRQEKITVFDVQKRGSICSELLGCGCQRKE